MHDFVYDHGWREQWRRDDGSRRNNRRRRYDGQTRHCKRLNRYDGLRGLDCIASSNSRRGNRRTGNCSTCGSETNEDRNRTAEVFHAESPKSKKKELEIINWMWQRFSPALR
jgi:hypothetical protein